MSGGGECEGRKGERSDREYEGSGGERSGGRECEGRGGQRSDEGGGMCTRKKGISIGERSEGACEGRRVSGHVRGGERSGGECQGEEERGVGGTSGEERREEWEGMRGEGRPDE